MSEAVVSVQGLGKQIDDRQLLRDISVTVPQGSVIGVLGKNGAGKTTLLEILLGFSPASSGSSHLFGHDSFRLPVAVKRRIGFVPQQDELVGMLTGEQQLLLNASLNSRWNAALIDRLCIAWELPVSRLIGQMSVGERQKLSILLALGHEPDLLVLDEPVASLDPIARRRFLQQLLEIAAQETRTVLFSTHIVSDLERVASGIWILREGVLAWDGELDALKESVVRLNIRARGKLPAHLSIAGALSCRSDGLRATTVVKGWIPGTEQALQSRLDADITVENLGLEDIFVELHA